MQQFSQLRPLLLSPATRPLVLVMVVPLAATCLFASTLSANQIQARQDATQAEVRAVAPDRQRRAEDPPGSETPMHDPPVRIIRGGDPSDAHMTPANPAVNQAPDTRFAAPGPSLFFDELESIDESFITNCGGLRGPPAAVTS